MVVNVKYEKFDVYIGRRYGHAGYFGNPHVIGYCTLCKETHDRMRSIAAYSKYFYERMRTDDEFKARILELRGKRLGCFCSPLACHGNVIANFLNRIRDE